MASRGYADLHEHLAALKKAGLLITVERPINKDTEMHPLVRWQFRGGIEERDRKAFLFTNVVDSKGRKYDMPVVVGALAASREIYRLGMGCDLERINETWSRALANPIEPRVVRDALCQEIVIEGSELDKPGKGLDALPIPISTPGWDIAPFTTLSQYITKDPDNGIQNMGIYRGQVKAPRRLGMNPSLELRPGIYVHWEKMKRAGKKLPAAVVLGAPPCIAFASAQKAPETLDELHLAGGLAGVPINVVKAKTVDLLVPAEAEIVVEGCIETEYLALEPLFLDHLRNALGIRGVKRVSMHEPLTNLRKVVVLVMDRDTPGTETWRALYGAAAWNRAAGKYVIAVNDDIDPDNADALLWAMSYRANPDLDLQILRHRDQGHGPRSKRNHGEDASVLIDATMKEDFPPISLPKREYMERAKAIWEELGLPRLKPESPWYGYSLGEWPDELERAASMAVKGDYFETGKLLAKRRRKDVGMNTEVRELPGRPTSESDE